MVLIISAFAVAKPIQDPTPRAISRTPWTILGTAVADGNEPADPNASQRSYSQVITSSKAVKWLNLPERINTVIFRFSEKTEGVLDTQWQVYVAWDERVFHKIATVVLSTGEQKAKTPDFRYAREIVLLDEYWLNEINVITPAGDTITLLAFDTCGIKHVVFIPTILTSDAQIEGTGF